MAAEATEIIVIEPQSVMGRIGKTFRTVRRLPIIPVFFLALVVFAGITANWIDLHDAENGDLADRVLPPWWGGVTTIDKTVVEKVAPGQRYREVALDGKEFNEALAFEEAQALEEGRPAVTSFVLGDKMTVVIREEGTTRFPLGTDHLGRDIYSRLVHGARISLIIALVTLGVGGTLGVFLGLVSGWYGGWVDELIMRLVDVILSLPLILVTLVLVVSVGQSLELIVAVLSLWIWPRFARMVRGEVLQLKTMDYVALARVSGASTLRIMFIHLFPGTINTLIVVATLQVGIVILVEATLSFLGAGIPPPTPAWGSMVADGRDRLAASWWISTMPGLAIVLTVMSLNLFGDWLRDTLDPKLRQVE
jgi:peptide/nickel transport system permease protein